MKLTNAIEGGLAGATTLTLLQEALHRIDHRSPRPLLHKSGIIKKLRKGSKGHDSKLYIRLAGELLGNAALFGLTGLGKKKNAILRGGLLGATAGLGSAFLADEREKEKEILQPDGTTTIRKNGTKDKIITVTLYTLGGILAGAAVQKINGGRKGKKKRKK
jgi:hypothetical protein